MFFWSFSRGHLISQFDQLLTSPVSPQPPVQRAHHVRQVGWFSNHISGTFITWSGTTHQNRWWSDWIFPHWNPMKLYQTLWKSDWNPTKLYQSLECKPPYFIAEVITLSGLHLSFHPGFLPSRVCRSRMGCNTRECLRNLKGFGPFAGSRRIWNINEISSPGENRLRVCIISDPRSMEKDGGNQCFCHNLKCIRRCILINLIFHFLFTSSRLLTHSCYPLVNHHPKLVR